MIDAAIVASSMSAARERAGEEARGGEGSTPFRAVGLDVVTLGEAFEREAPILLAAARAITLDDAEAQDLVQITFELALRRRASLRDPGALRSWLLVIQTREALRIMRRLRRLVRLDVGLVEVPSPVGGSADSLVIRDALRRLPPRIRAAVVLHHMVGLPVDETAACLGTSVNTVKSQLKTGLARLRELLRDD